MIKLSSYRDFEALLLGASIYAAGGGGDPVRGLELVKRVFVDRHRALEVLDVDEAGGGCTASVYEVGTVAPSARLRKAARVANTVDRALELLRSRLGVELSTFHPVELGGGNTAVTLYAAGLANLPVLDGDRVGRAAPEIHQDTAILFGKSLAPAVAVTPTGNEVLILSYADVDDYEAMLRNLSILAGTHVTVIDAVMSVEEARRVLIRGSLTKCLELGKAVLEAREKGIFVPRVVAEHMGGWVVMRGIVKSWRWRNEGGFLHGEMVIEGVEEHRGRVLRSLVKNEHIAAWLDGEPLVLPPDILTLLSRDGEPILNSRVVEGMEVWVVAAPAPAVWRSERGLELFGPRRFGIDIEYEPVEVLVRRLGLL
ncbi:MAG: DUF917 domain-containing protein [Crenarchaeota archaeon]|nr:DUF917 domain-containing protein [Thermoproteota archaeon]